MKSQPTARLGANLAYTRLNAIPSHEKSAPLKTNKPDAGRQAWFYEPH